MAIDVGDGQSSSTSGVSPGSIKVTDAVGFELLDVSEIGVISICYF